MFSCWQSKYISAIPPLVVSNQILGDWPLNINWAPSAVSLTARVVLSGVYPATKLLGPTCNFDKLFALPIPTLPAK